MERVYPEPPHNGAMTILHGQAELSPEIFYYAFMPPRLRRLNPGRKTNFDFSIAMPLHEYGLDSNGHYYERELPTFGRIKLMVKLGFLYAPFQPKTGDPWGEFMGLQKLTSANTITVNVEGP